MGQTGLTNLSIHSPPPFHILYVPNSGFLNLNHILYFYLVFESGLSSIVLCIFVAEIKMVCVFGYRKLSF